MLDGAAYLVCGMIETQLARHHICGLGAYTSDPSRWVAIIQGFLAVTFTVLACAPHWSMSLGLRISKDILPDGIPWRILIEFPDKGIPVLYSNLQYSIHNNYTKAWVAEWHNFKSGIRTSTNIYLALYPIDQLFVWELHITARASRYRTLALHDVNSVTGVLAKCLFRVTEARVRFSSVVHVVREPAHCHLTDCNSDGLTVVCTGRPPNHFPHNNSYNSSDDLAATTRLCSPLTGTPPVNLSPSNTSSDDAATTAAIPLRRANPLFVQHHWPWLGAKLSLPKPEPRLDQICEHKWSNPSLGQHGLALNAPSAFLQPQPQLDPLHPSAIAASLNELLSLIRPPPLPAPEPRPTKPLQKLLSKHLSKISDVCFRHFHLA